MSIPGKGVNAARPDGLDLLDYLGRYLSAPAPRVVLVKGPSGAGKSSLLRALVPLVPAPRLFVGYRVVSGGTAEASSPPGTPEVTLMIFDPSQAPPREATPEPDPPSVPLSFAPSGLVSTEPIPASLRLGLGRLAEAGGGCVIVDAWESTTEPGFRAVGAGDGPPSVVRAPLAVLTDLLGVDRTRTLVALVGEPTPQIASVADGVIDLGVEAIDGTELRVLRIVRLRGEPSVDTRFLFSLEGGKFLAPAPHRPGYVGPPGAGEPEPTSEVGSIWPGSADYARAFGRLRHHGLTAFELADQTPHPVSEALVVPMVVSVLRAGGRVVWVPGGMGSPAHIGRLLSPCLSTEAIVQGVRVLTASPNDPPAGGLAPIVLRVRRGTTPSPPPTGGPWGDPVAPLFPDAFRFLRDRRTDGPALFILSLDGLNALVAVTGSAYDPSTFPLIISTYARLPGFHGIGLGSPDHPLVQAMLPSVDVHVRVHQRHGRTVLIGTRPRTPAYLLDWPGPDGRYALVRVL